MLPRSQLHLCVRMDTASDITSCSQSATAAGEFSPVDKAALGSCQQPDAPELSCPASMHTDGSVDAGLDGITRGVGRLGDAEREESSSQELLDNPDSSEQNGKIPNRDSGIDSPSCHAEGEGFPNEGAIDEEDNYDSVTETESVSCCVTLSNKRDSTQDEDSDLDEGSGGDIHSLTDTQAAFLTDTHKVSSWPAIRPGTASFGFSVAALSSWAGPAGLGQSHHL